MQDDARRLVARAAMWFEGQLPADQQLSYYSVHVQGAKYHRANPVTYHTFACLYPDRGSYIVMYRARDEMPAAWRVSGPQIRDVIAGFTPSREHVLAQRQIAAAVMPSSTVALRWDAAVALGMAFELPVAVMGFGHTRENEIVVYQQSIDVAPLVMLATKFKLAVPHVILN